jgi:uncharacterized delta-60 repeat protein
MRKQIIFFAIIIAALFGKAAAAPGDLDPTFDGDGKTTTGFGYGFDAAFKVAMQSDGKIVAGGFAMNASAETVLALMRYNADGTPDPTFGNNGRVVTDLQDYYNWNVGLAIQTDGKILIASSVAPPLTQNLIGIERFDTNGNPDPAFGVGGKVFVDFFSYGEVANAIAIQNDGKILVGGFAFDSNGAWDFALVRMDTSGNLDGTFGSGGKMTLDFFGQRDEIRDIAIQADGKIVLAGVAQDSNYKLHFAVARLTTSGVPDPTFGVGGKTIASLGEYSEANAVSIQADGKIVAGGAAGAGSTATADFGLIRFDTSGNPDPTFGIGGQVTTNFFDALDWITDIEIQCDGKIVATGPINPNLIDVERYVDFGVARYDTSGNLDPTFGVGGKVNTDFGYADYAGGLAIQKDGKIVVVGYFWDLVTGGDADFAVARYNGDGGCASNTGFKCPLSHGYWKNNPSLWPVNSLALGGQTYSKSELLALLNASSNTDASLILARQLIAAKINVANGADPAPVSSTISHADSLLATFAGKLPYKVKSSSAVGASMTADTTILTNYNNGLLTPGCIP